MERKQGGFSFFLRFTTRLSFPLSFTSRSTWVTLSTLVVPRQAIAIHVGSTTRSEFSILIFTAWTWWGLPLLCRCTRSTLTDRIPKTATTELATTSLARSVVREIKTITTTTLRSITAFPFTLSGVVTKTITPLFRCSSVICTEVKQSLLISVFMASRLSCECSAVVCHKTITMDIRYGPSLPGEVIDERCFIS